MIGAGRLRTMMRVTLPLVAPGVLGAAIYRVRRDARLVLGGAGARLAEPVLCHHDGDLPAGVAVSAAHAARRRDGRVAVRGHVPRCCSSIAASPAGGSYVTVSGKAFRPRRDGCRRLALGAVRRLRSLRVPVGGPADRDADLRLGAAARRRPSRRADNFTLEHYRDRVVPERDPLGAWATACSSAFFTATIGVALTGLLAWLIQRSRCPDAARSNTS